MPNSSATSERKAADSSRGVGVAGADERGAQEQLPADRVVELLVLDDVAAVLEQERGDGVDDARAVPGSSGSG